jgi:hypothetical protein
LSTTYVLVFLEVSFLLVFSPIPYYLFMVYLTITSGSQNI